MFISEFPKGRVGGIAKGLEVLQAGDVFVYEMQTAGPNEKFVPVDYDKAVWDITQKTLKAGVIVVASAGNGYEDLDKKEFNRYRFLPDNGIIRVGAGNQLLRKKDFSTFGRV